MDKWFYKIQRFMIGRYGHDELNKFLFLFYLVLFIIDLFINFQVLNFLQLGIVFILFYRLLSKNIDWRRKENDCYLRVKKKVLRPFRDIKRNFKDRDYYVYKKCRYCKSTLKLPLPYKRGIQKVKCPICKKRIKFFCFRQEKIEIIKKKKNKNKE